MTYKQATSLARSIELAYPDTQEYVPGAEEMPTYVVVKEYPIYYQRQIVATDWQVMAGNWFFNDRIVGDYYGPYPTHAEASRKADELAGPETHRLELPLRRTGPRKDQP